MAAMINLNLQGLNLSQKMLNIQNLDLQKAAGDLLPHLQPLEQGSVGENEYQVESFLGSGEYVVRLKPKHFRNWTVMQKWEKGDSLIVLMWDGGRHRRVVEIADWEMWTHYQKDHSNLEFDVRQVLNGLYSFSSKYVFITPEYVI